MVRISACDRHTVIHISMFNQISEYGWPLIIMSEAIFENTEFHEQEDQWNRRLLISVPVKF